jgi:hypothetical protein
VSSACRGTTDSVSITKNNNRLSGQLIFPKTMKQDTTLIPYTLWKNLIYKKRSFIDHNKDGFACSINKTNSMNYMNKKYSICYKYKKK